MIETGLFSDLYLNHQLISDSVLEFWGRGLDIVLLGNCLLLRLLLESDGIIKKFVIFIVVTSLLHASLVVNFFF